MPLETPFEAIPGLQRVTMGNGVWYVHENPMKRPPTFTPPATAPAQATPAPASAASALAPHAEASAGRPPQRRWPATVPPPRGYAYEFGTGRLVPMVGPVRFGGDR